MLNGEFVLTVFPCSRLSAVIRIFQTLRGVYLLPFLNILNCKISLKGPVLSLLADGCTSIDTFWLGSSQRGGENRNQNVLSIRKYSWTIYPSVQDAFSIPGNLTLFICNEISRPRWEIAAEQFSGMGFIYHNFRATLSNQYIARSNLNGGRGLVVTTFLPPVWSKYCLTHFKQLNCMHLLRRHKIATVFT